MHGMVDADPSGKLDRIGSVGCDSTIFETG
jgi:hypothetical protein